jgi:phosphopantothenoylcysteine decarboxylase/phosphopantothenate--cysteine ligase
LTGLTALVTAGGTREYLDAVRFIGNPATGRMGYALAGALTLRGAKVILVGANCQLAPPYGVKVFPVVSAEEMAQAVSKHSQGAQIIVMSAAVSDYIPQETLKNKRKKDAASWKMELSPALDILAELGKRKSSGQLLVGFAAETEQLKENAQKKLSAKNLDLICANPVNEPGVGFGSSENRLLLLDSSGGQLEIPQMSKQMAAELIVDKIVELWQKKGK